MAKNATTVVELLMGLGGRATSGGCVQMQAYLNSLDWCICNLRAWDDWRRSAEVLGNVKPGVHRVQAGYSNGGSMVSKVAGFGFPIDLCFGFDPTIWLPPKSFGVNVGVVYNLNNWGPSFVGHAAYSRDQAAASLPLTNQKIFMLHGSVDKTVSNQQAFYSQIKRINNTAVWTKQATAWTGEAAIVPVPGSLATGASLATEFRPESGG